MVWSSDYASRLLDLFGDIALDWPGTPSKWVITNEHINNDIEVTYDDAQGDTVRVSVDAFQNSVPRLAQHNGVYGQYFSNRLFDVVVRYVTKNGTDADKVDQILQKHFGCSITVPDYEALTAETTGETASAFEAFKPEELIAIIGMFQEMPEGFHKVPGLKYLVRRIDGSRNPIYPLAAAVSWVDNDPGYIEFIDDAFLGDVVNDTFRLILHEKTHFLWHDLFSDSTKQEWIRIGGWHEDSTTESGWSTDKMTEFVSAYSHDANPDEDMAESVAFYVLNPAKLQANAPEKYDFIKNCIMHGETYKAQIRDDLTFDVYNLYPDYAYPGRVVGMSVDVQGASDEDKTVTVTVDLDTHGNPAFGGEGGYMRIASTKVDQMYEASLEKTKEDGSQMRATFNVSKYSAADYWKCTSLSINDSAGNVRYLSDNNFGWKLYIDNALEDLEAPRFVEDSLKVDLVPEALADGKVITHVTISFYATDNGELADCYCEIANNTHETYRLDKWGTVDAQTGLCTVTYDFTGYYPSGEYSINHIKIHDKAKNGGGFNFYPDGSGTKSYTTFWFEGENPDLVGPELDVNNISISATPTNPDEPNGETIVKLGFWIKDNLSGLDYGSYNLLDPQGNIHMNYFYEPNHGWPFFDGDPTVWKYYESTIVLPVGSAPGLWGLQSMRLYDKAANFRDYNFEEIVHFKPASGDQLAAWGIVCDKSKVSVGQNYQLSIEGNNDGKEVVWECTNGTGRAIVDSKGRLTPLSEGAVTVFAYAKDDTSVFGSIDIDIRPEDPCANGHEIVTDQAVAATCEAAGLTEGSHCSRCGEVLVAQKEVPAIGHAPEVVAAVPATCTAPGLTEGSRCSNCGEVLAAQEKTEALGHDFEYIVTTPTCEDCGFTTGVCRRCGLSAVSNSTDPTGHAWESSVVEKPTCEKDGVKSFSCATCGKTYSEPIPALGHSIVVDEAVMATCQNPGKTEGSHCLRCGEITKTREDVPALGHDLVVDEAVAATCTQIGLTAGSHCSRCGEILRAREEIPALGHDYETKRVEPTCASAGFVDRKCSRCGEGSYDQLPSLGHEIVTDQAVAATCEAAGLTEGSHCSRCGEVLVAQKEVPAIGHAPEVVAAVPATCTAPGLTEGSRCSNCGEVLAAQEKTEALGHDFAVNRVPSTCIEDGSVNYTCRRCGYHYSEVASKTGHEWGAWSVTKEPTVSETGVMTRVCDECGAEETKPINRLEPSTPEVENDLRHAALSLSNTRFEYDGFAKEPGVNVALNGKTLVQGIDYSITSYVDNVIPGQATVTVSGMGSYIGIASMNFDIVRSEGNELALPGSWVNGRNGWWYQNSDGSYPVSCWRIIEGVRYSFDSYGYMQVGWKAENDAWYYLDPSGAMETGWQQVGGAWYWFANDGVMATGWRNIESAWYLFASSGAMLTGWQQIGGTWYYLSGSGIMCTGWQQIGGSWYWFANSGAMAIGWFQAGGTYYYADGSGAMQRSRWVGDYYLTGSGAMATNQWIGPYYVDANGKWVR